MSAITLEEMFDSDEEMPVFGSVLTVPAQSEAFFAPPKNHSEATTIAYTTFIYRGVVVNMTVRQGTTKADIDGQFNAIDYIQERVLAENGLFTIGQQPMYVVVDDEAITVSVKKVPFEFAAPQEPVKGKSNGSYDPDADDAFVPKQYQGAQAPAQPKAAVPAGQKSDLIVFEVERIEWAGATPSKSKPGELTTTFKAYGGNYHKFGVTCYPEALQKAGFDIGGAGAGWVTDVTGEGWKAHCFPGDSVNAYGDPSPRKVAFLSKT